ncbi:DUF1540 domain-containing protein [Pleurocapsales cyanobacterium LEGE 10410]|nr:DUF1540 domain-containing protein [Pleurocapsales cyanobacterium LEGE 10410]
MTKNRNPVDSGAVSQCTANNCLHNQEKQCNAGAIYFNVLAEQANCYNYTSDTQQTLETKEAGQVAQCSVIDCFYNEVQGCVADSITVSLTDGIAKCDTYVVADGDRQI